MNVLIYAINVLMETVGWMICAMTCFSSCWWSYLSISMRQVWCMILLIIHFLCLFELHAPKLYVQPFSCDLHTKFRLPWSEYIVLQSKWFLMLYSLTARIHYFFYRRSCQPRVHWLVVVHYLVAERNDVD